MSKSRQYKLKYVEAEEFTSPSPQELVWDIGKWIWERNIASKVLSIRFSSFPDGPDEDLVYSAEVFWENV